METSPVRQCTTPKRVILGTVNAQSNGSPISPMANLKLLTKVATSHVSMDEKTQEYIILSPEKKTPVKYARQLRSLSFICRKFLEFYELNIPSGKHKPLSLGQLTILLGIEKRRVYDIINIVASLKFATKVCQDKYLWYGNQFLVSTLCEIRTYAINHNYHLRLQQKCFNNNNNNSDMKILEEIQEWENSENQKGKVKGLYHDNRMGALCQKCMMLFLVAPKGEALNFKIISSLILPQNVMPDKNGMRRLYDISNVLESLGLISRIDNKHLKKPSFVYSGPVLPDEYTRVLEPAMLPELESSTDSTSDFSEMKFQDILEVVCTELDKKDSLKGAKKFTGKICGSFCGITAKKKLFPEEKGRISERAKPYESNRFVKAPSSSFRWSSSGIVKIPDHTYDRPQRLNTFNPLPQISSALSGGSLPISPSAPVVTSLTSFAALPSLTNTVTVTTPTVPCITSIAKPIAPTKFKFSSPPLQNGSYYKVVKEGDVVHFVKLNVLSSEYI